MIMMILADIVDYLKTYRSRKFAESLHLSFSHLCMVLAIEWRVQYLHKRQRLQVFYHNNYYTYIAYMYYCNV